METITQNKYNVSFVLSTKTYAKDIKEAIHLACENWNIDESCLGLISGINVQVIEDVE
jgi:hypothetical protein